MHSFPAARRLFSAVSWAAGGDDWPPAFVAEAVKVGGKFFPSDLCQYSGIQIPKNQKPHPPNAGLNIGVAL
jgi:hypothetical protein